LTKHINFYFFAKGVVKSGTNYRQPSLFLRATPCDQRTSNLLVAADDAAIPDEKTGQLPGIDEGWDYAPGAARATPLADLVEQKLFNLDAAIGAAMRESLAPAIEMERSLKWAATIDGWLSDPVVRGPSLLSGHFPARQSKSSRNESRQSQKRRKLVSTTVWLLERSSSDMQRRRMASSLLSGDISQESFAGAIPSTLTSVTGSWFLLVTGRTRQ
jgi:hypothetical protein